MAEEALGKGVKQLKHERTIAKSAFTKQANFLSWAAGNMTKSELQEAFKVLTSHVRQMMITVLAYWQIVLKLERRAKKLN